MNAFAVAENQPNCDCAKLLDEEHLRGLPTAFSAFSQIFCIRIPALRTETSFSRTALTVCPYDPMRQNFETETQCGRRNFGGTSEGRKKTKKTRAPEDGAVRGPRAGTRAATKNTLRACVSRRARTRRSSPRMNQPEIRPRRPARARQSPRKSIMRRCYLHSGRDPRNIPKQDALAVP